MPQLSLLINQRKVLWMTKQTWWRWIGYSLRKRSLMCCWSTWEAREPQCKTRGIPVSCFGPHSLRRPIQSQHFHRVFEQNTLTVCMSVFVFRYPLCYLHMRCTQEHFFFLYHSPSFSLDIVVTLLLYLLNLEASPCLLFLFFLHSHPFPCTSSLGQSTRQHYSKRCMLDLLVHMACWRRDITIRDCNWWIFFW